jgi:hypothetical protein
MSDKKWYGGTVIVFVAMLGWIRAAHVAPEALGHLTPRATKTAGRF